MEQVPRRTGFSPAVPSRKGLRHPGYTGVPPGCPRGCNEDKSLAYLINSQRSPAQPAPFHLSRGPRRHVLSSLPFLRASVFELGSWIESRASFCPGQPTTSNVLSPLLILSLSLSTIHDSRSYEIRPPNNTSLPFPFYRFLPLFLPFFSPYEPRAILVRKRKGVDR